MKPYLQFCPHSTAFLRKKPWEIWRKGCPTWNQSYEHSNIVNIILSILRPRIHDYFAFILTQGSLWKFLWTILILVSFSWRLCVLQVYPKGKQKPLQVYKSSKYRHLVESPISHVIEALLESIHFEGHVLPNDAHLEDVKTNRARIQTWKVDLFSKAFVPDQFQI